MKANKLKRGAKSILLFRNWNIVVLTCIFAVLSIYGYRSFHSLNPLYAVQNVVFLENKRLTDEELREIVGVRAKGSLLTVSSSEVSRQMLRSPWIKTARVRKEFPDTLSITIRETDPFALLDMNEHLFLLDERGKFLEELRDDAEPFLPIIVSDPFKEKEGFSEALNLVRLLNDKGLTSGKDHVEIIAHSANEVCVIMDETVVKMGSGRYDEKLERFIQLERELRSRNIPVDYIDLRFGNKAIVKPIAAKKVEE